MVSGGTITKLHNQLLDISARLTVMVGLWSKINRLIPEQEFKLKTKEGWLQGRKQKVSKISVDKPPSEAPAFHVDISN